MTITTQTLRQDNARVRTRDAELQDVIETRLWLEEHDWLYGLLRSDDNVSPTFRFPDLISASVSLVFAHHDAPRSYLPVSRDRTGSSLAPDTAPPRIDVAAAVPVAAGPATLTGQSAPQPQVSTRPTDDGLRRPVPDSGWLRQQPSCGRPAATWPNEPIAGGMRHPVEACSPQRLPLFGIHPLLTRSLTVTSPG
jgi:hypothetical protein